MIPDAKSVARRFIRANQTGPAYSVFGDYLEPWPVPLGYRLPDQTRCVIRLRGRPYEGEILKWIAGDDEQSAQYVVQYIDNRIRSVRVPVSEVYLSTAEIPNG